jgi:hypothetical protein
MKAYRTDSGGTYKNDVRIKIVKKIIKHMGIEGINKINDHKGTLFVHWAFIPSENDKLKCEEIWNVFNEYNIEHITNEFGKFI